MARNTRSVSTAGSARSYAWHARATLLIAGLLVGVGATLPGAAYQRPGGAQPVHPIGGWYPVVSADGGSVAWWVQPRPGSPTGTADNILVYDRRTQRLEDAHVGRDGRRANCYELDCWPAASGHIAMNDTGRYVAFETRANTMLPEGEDTRPDDDVYVYDRETRTHELISVAADGWDGGNYESRDPSLSADGRYVAFASVASNLVPNDTNNGWDMFVRDRVAKETTLVSVAMDGAPSDHANGPPYPPSISADGRYVVFASESPDLVPNDDNMMIDVFVHDLETRQTERVSVATDGTEGNLPASQADISADGRYVLFLSLATNLVPTDTNPGWDAFIRDRHLQTTERVSVASDGTERMASAWWPTISDDGRFASFTFFLDGYAPLDEFGGDTAGEEEHKRQVVVHDRQTGATELASINAEGVTADDYVDDPRITADGRFVVFMTAATNLGGVDDPEMPGAPIYIRDRGLPLGANAIEVVSTGGDVTVTGTATFAGAVLADDQDSDSGDLLSPDADILGGSVIYRPENEDVLIRLQTAAIRQTPVIGGGDPTLVYGARFTIGGTAYEVRSERDPRSSLYPTFGLHRCAPECAWVAEVSGAVGTTGNEVRISVPLAAAGAGEGSRFENVSAYTRSLDPVASNVLDELALSDFVIPPASVRLGMAPAGTPESEVEFTAPGSLVHGRFTATIDVEGLGAGAYDVWARACLGGQCEASRAATPFAKPA